MLETKEMLDGAGINEQDQPLRLIFMPIANRVESSTYLLYDGACGTGGIVDSCRGDVA